MALLPWVVLAQYNIIVDGFAQDTGTELMSAVMPVMEDTEMARLTAVAVTELTDANRNDTGTDRTADTKYTTVATVLPVMTVLYSTVLQSGV